MIQQTTPLVSSCPRCGQSLRGATQADVFDERLIHPFGCWVCDSMACASSRVRMWTGETLTRLWDRPDKDPDWCPVRALPAWQPTVIASFAAPRREIIQEHLAVQIEQVDPEWAEHAHIHVDWTLGPPVELEPDEEFGCWLHPTAFGPVLPEASGDWWYACERIWRFDACPLEWN